MIGRLFKMQIKPGMKTELVEFLRWATDSTKESESGTLRLDIWESDADPNTIFFYEAFLNSEAFEIHLQHEPNQQWGEVREKCIEALEVLVNRSSPLASIAD